MQILNSHQRILITVVSDEMLLLCIITAFLPTIICVNSVFVNWLQGHDNCIATLEIEKGKIHSENSNTLCESSSYYKYFQKIIEKPPSEYHKLIANEIINLYTNLENQVQPMSVHVNRPNGNQETVNIHPIGFSLPEENVVSQVPPKIKSFGRVIPGITSTYYHLYNESLYYEDMRKSLFVLTYKKGGWDCLRHYEIIAAGSLPLFPDISDCPSHSLTLHPKSLYQLFLKQPGLELTGHRTGQMTYQFDKMEMNLSLFDSELYSATVSAMLQYFHNVLSTKAIAKYLLDTMCRYSQGKLKKKLPTKILYLTHQDHDMDKGDYATDLILHGLIKLLGEQPIVTDFPSRDCLYKTSIEFNETSYLNRRLKLYGSGFSWGLKIDHFSKEILRNQKQIETMITNHEYDLIILGSGHRDGWASRLWYWDLICKYYHPLEVGFIDGADYHLKKKILEKYSQCAGHLFSREGYSHAHH
jgi:hypothetical protein